MIRICTNCMQWPGTDSFWDWSHFSSGFCSCWVDIHFGICCWNGDGCFFAAAVSFYTWRLSQFQMKVPDFQLAIESNFWIFSVFAFGYKYLNRPGKALRYLSQAAYPIYIVHFIFLFLASLLIFPLDIEVHLKFVLTLAFTGIGCFIFYEFIIRRLNIIRPLFGLKTKTKVYKNNEPLTKNWCNSAGQSYSQHYRSNNLLSSAWPITFTACAFLLRFQGAGWFGVSLRLTTRC